MIQITIITLLISLLAGVPIAFSIGIAGTAGLLLGTDIPAMMLVQKFFAGINSFSYMAIPLFILAGSIMGKGGISGRIVRFAGSLLSWLPGGIGITSVGANMIFAGVSGSGSAAVSAIGGITVPEMVKKGYSRGFIAALIGGGGSLGPIIPPSIDMIVFGCLTGFSIGRIFLGGIVPGVMIGLMLMVYCFIYAKKKNIDYGGGFDPHVVWVSFKEAIWALFMPIIIIGGIMLGIFTATEAGGVACVYGLIVSMFVYKELKPRELIEIFKTATVNTAMVMMIMGMSTIFSYLLAFENVGENIVNLMLGISEDPTVLFFLVIGFMVIIGCFMESLAALPIILPIIYPMFDAMGVSLNQLAVVFALSTVLGGLTPPVGIYLFLSMTIAKAKMLQTVWPHLLIVVFIMLLTIVLCIFFPPLTTFIPNLVMGPLT